MTGKIPSILSLALACGIKMLNDVSSKFYIFHLNNNNSVLF